MAHAARLNLRMQKELKLLLTDPPPGASFPLLSGDSDLSSSLSTIHAQIEGPEGTVYAKGFFDIKIQIPERYPFQPPIVTFDTPIYHPNIDNGGRICLDILNLPPKGAWQPSLNISTVLTSIGLLLTEPNPDDGLMCEASREYKYNRQAFDQKARLMTEKYAKGGIEGSSSSPHVIQTNSNSSVTEVSEKSKLEVSEAVSSQKKPCGISQKYSLESSSSSNGQLNGLQNELLPFSNKMEVIGKRKVASDILDDHNLNNDKPHGNRRKLSLEYNCEIQKRDRTEKKNLVTNYSSSFDSQNVAPVATSGPLVLQPEGTSERKILFPQAREPVIVTSNVSTKQSCGFGRKESWEESSDIFQLNGKEKISTSGGTSSKILSEQEPCNNNFSDTDRTGKCYNDAECKKIPPVRKKLSLGSKRMQRTENKENVAPSAVDKPSLSSHQSRSPKKGFGQEMHLDPLVHQHRSNTNNREAVDLENHSMTSSRDKEKKQLNLEQDTTDCSKSGIERKEDSLISETVIVLDSEDSEDEMDGALRSRLLSRRRMGKWRAKA